MYDDDRIKLLLILSAALEDREHDAEQIAVLLHIEIFRADIFERDGDHFRIHKDRAEYSLLRFLAVG